MKRTITRTEIRFEKRQRVTVRGGRRRVALCEHCSAQVVMLTPDDAAALLETTARAIFRRIEAGELHFIETRGGALLLCLNSLELASSTKLQPATLIENPQT